MAADGHFWADVDLDGVTRRMLIDSGATTTAISEATALEAKLKDDSPFPVVLNTANGQITARTATASRIVIGSIIARDVPVVVSPAFGNTDVVGMNVLSRLRAWRVEGRTLVLTP
jgi:aspartyl protease family protein